MEARMRQSPQRESSTGSSPWFQELRPSCVKISQLAIRDSDSPDTARQLIQLTEQLLEVLQKVDAANPLSPKLAEYVFFPLSHIFRQLGVFPPLLIENCLKCLQVLILHGWASELSGDLARQLLSLLTVVVDGKPGSAQKAEIPEETMLEGFRTMSAIFSTNAFRVGPSLTENDFLPTTGHAISVVLDALETAPYAQVQSEAAKVIERGFSTLKAQSASEAFLPGTVSAFAKLLSTPAKYKSSVLANVTKALTLVLTKSLGDMRMEQMKWTFVSKRSNGGQESEDEVQFAKWARASAAQIKIALGAVMKLHKTESPLVRQALYQASIQLLDECHTSLENCASMLVETAIILSDQQDHTPRTIPNLMDLVSIHVELKEVLKNTVYDWMTSLARQMQANDDRQKQAAFTNLTKGVEMMKQARIESSTLESALSSSMTDSLVTLMTVPGPAPASSPAQVQLIANENKATSIVASERRPYEDNLMAGDNSGDLRASIVAYLSTVSSLPQKARVTDSLLQNLEGSATNVEVASLWLSFELCKASAARSAEVDALLNFGEDSEDDAVFEELYSYSVDMLSAHTDVDDGDWRLDFIAMEIVAHAASRSGTQYRPELIDVLFPIATFLGSGNEKLRQQAVATLNSLALSCQYGSVSELLIANVDYVVNSVSLRLNSLDISPASIAVLTMMVRLSGPKLVPFLDDVVDSIFAALENYHGYTSFVESLFSVLHEIVGSAVKADKAMLTSSDTQTTSHRKVRATAVGLRGVLQYFKREESRKADDEIEETTGKRPDGPFQRFAQPEEEEEGGETSNGGQEVEKPPNPPTYQLLLRIASLTQHYLTSPTPKLRRSLLDVLATAAPVLGEDEGAFLPLINSVWPVILDRLYDTERYVAIEACHALSSLCAAAGDFLGSRFKTVWWDGMSAWCRRSKGQAIAHSKRGGPASRDTSKSTIMLPYKHGDSSILMATTADHQDMVDDGGLGQHASQAKLWEGIVGLLVSMVTYVRMDDEMFDEILELLADELEKNKEAREALEIINADAVWLIRFERGRVTVDTPPEGPLLSFADVRKFSPVQISVGN